MARPMIKREKIVFEITKRNSSTGTTKLKKIKINKGILCITLYQ